MLHLLYLASRHHEPLRRPTELTATVLNLPRVVARPFFAEARIVWRMQDI